MMLGPAQRGVSADEREPVGTMMLLSGRAVMALRMLSIAVVIQGLWR